MSYSYKMSRFYCDDELLSAEEVLNVLNSTLEKSEPVTIEDYYSEWEKIVKEVSDKEVELINLKEVYSEKEQEILLNTDFKELYGKNNDSIRKNHIKKTLQAMTDAKNDLEISISYLKRRIEFIKSLMNMQRTLLQTGMVE